MADVHHIRRGGFFMTAATDILQEAGDLQKQSMRKNNGSRIRQRIIHRGAPKDWSTHDCACPPLLKTTTVRKLRPCSNTIFFTSLF
jgi:hypothetical protein